MGADIVIHSATKFINGHSDVVVGALMTNNLDKLFYLQNAVGCQSPFELVLRGVITLALWKNLCSALMAFVVIH